MCPQILVIGQRAAARISDCVAKIVETACVPVRLFALTRSQGCVGETSVFGYLREIIMEKNITRNKVIMTKQEMSVRFLSTIDISIFQSLLSFLPFLFSVFFISI